MLSYLWVSLLEQLALYPSAQSDQGGLLGRPPGLLIEVQRLHNRGHAKLVKHSGPHSQLRGPEIEEIYDGIASKRPLGLRYILHTHLLPVYEM